MTEEWRAIPGYEGLYSVSSMGNVRSENRTIYTKAGPRRYRSRNLRPIVHKKHRAVTLTRKDKSRTSRLIHHLVLEAFIGPRPKGKEGCHRNDLAHDNRLENLYWGTSSENMRDRVANGLHHNAIKTHCKRGHLLAGANLLPGTRQCKVCSRAHSWRRKGRNFEEALRHWEGVHLG